MLIAGRHLGEAGVDGGLAGLEIGVVGDEDGPRGRRRFGIGTRRLGHQLFMQAHPRPGLHGAAGLQGAVHADQGRAGHLLIVGQVEGLVGVQVHRVGCGVGRVQATPSPGGRAVPQGADLEAVAGADVRRRIAGLIVIP
ncbi:MAG: hypothetical protein C0461_13200, partial [Brevundimonas sp.]|nr:hypothetical protein [Brevundimonas sp.]